MGGPNRAPSGRICRLRMRSLNMPVIVSAGLETDTADAMTAITVNNIYRILLILQSILWVPARWPRDIRSL